MDGQLSRTQSDALRLHQQFDRLRAGRHVAGAGTSQNTLCWCISKGWAGMNSQTSGLARAVGVPFEFRHALLRFPWSCLPLNWVPRSSSVLTDPSILTTEPMPQLVISCGRQGILPSLTLKKMLGDRVFTVHIQDPHIDPANFDLVVIPAHDGTRGDNVYLTTGALHYVTAERLNEARHSTEAASLGDDSKPLVLVLLGGPNGCYRFSTADMNRFTDKLRKLTTQNDVRLAILKSNRTPQRVVEQLTQEFGRDHFVWNGQGTNPYFAALSRASSIIVTGDSVSMVTEATATGRPVFVEHLTEIRPARRFRHFHQMFEDGGFTRPFEGLLAEWSYEPPNDTPRIARIIRERMGLK